MLILCWKDVQVFRIRTHENGFLKSSLVTSLLVCCYWSLLYTTISNVFTGLVLAARPDGAPTKMNPPFKKPEHQKLCAHKYRTPFGRRVDCGNVVRSQPPTTHTVHSNRHTQHLQTKPTTHRAHKVCASATWKVRNACTVIRTFSLSTYRTQIFSIILGMACRHILSLSLWVWIWRTGRGEGVGGFQTCGHTRT